jgi:hypothetical protein
MLVSTVSSSRALEEEETSRGFCGLDPELWVKRLAIGSRRRVACFRKSKLGYGRINGAVEYNFALGRGSVLPHNMCTLQSRRQE